MTTKSQEQVAIATAKRLQELEGLCELAAAWCKKERSTRAGFGFRPTWAEEMTRAGFDTGIKGLV
jgi:hypothetical protein